MQVIALVVLAFALSMAVATVVALPVMWLWNAALVGAISGVNEIGFFQALGITLLASILMNVNVKVSQKG